MVHTTDIMRQFNGIKIIVNFGGSLGVPYRYWPIGLWYNGYYFSQCSMLTRDILPTKLSFPTNGRSIPSDPFLWRSV